jgi:hypothetical protein
VAEETQNDRQDPSKWEPIEGCYIDDGSKPVIEVINGRQYIRRTKVEAWKWKGEIK